MAHPKNKHDRERIGRNKGKRRVEFLWVSDRWTREEQEQYLKEWARHRRDVTKECSCPMCGNPRKYFDEKTMQERKREMKDKLDEIHSDEES